MWFVSGKPVDPGQFAPFRPEEILYDFDGPRTFTLRDENDELHLAHWCDEDDQISRYLVARFRPHFVDRLKSGTLALRDALDQPQAWVVDVRHTGQVASVWRVQLSELPAEVLPQPGTVLWPFLEPLRTYEFALVLAGVAELSDEQAAALYDAGCRDATPVTEAGRVLLHFAREAASLEQAIRSAIADVSECGLRAARVEIECPV